MKKVLKEINVAGHPGGNQKWLLGDPLMYLGGCAAITACDMSIYFALNFGRKELYPFRLSKITENLTKTDYKKFTKIMKPYLRPRIEGVSELHLFTEGFGKYIADRYAETNQSGSTFEKNQTSTINQDSKRNQDKLTLTGESKLQMATMSFDEPFDDLKQTIIKQIDLNLPIPILILQHQDKTLDDYSWHWFWIAGYEIPDTDISYLGDISSEKAGSENTNFDISKNDIQIKVISYGESAWFSFRKLWDSGYDRKGGLILFDEL